MVRFFRNSVILFFALFFLMAFAHAADAATIFLSPASGTYAPGGTFSVAVYVSTDEAINAVSGTINFPTQNLQVVSISKTGSIISLWATEPTFVNSQGTIRFEGIAPNPGYTGAAGKIITITFRAGAAGGAQVRMSDASVLANDGNATNVLTSMGSANYTINGVQPVPQPQPQPAGPKPIPTESETTTATTTPTTTPAVTEPIPSVVTPVEPSLRDELLAYVDPVILLVILLLLICVVLAIMTAHLYVHGRLIRGSIRKRTHSTQKTLHKAFALLIDDMNKYIENLENSKLSRVLTKEETHLLKNIRKDLKDAEGYLEMEIEKIEHSA